MTILQEAGQALIRASKKDCPHCDGTAWMVFDGCKIICFCVEWEIGVAYHQFVDNYLSGKLDKLKKKV